MEQKESWIDEFDEIFANRKVIGERTFKDYHEYLYPDIKQFISNLISQEREKWIDELTEKFQMEGDFGKLTPFQQTVNTYIKNRGEEIKKDLIQKQ